MATIVNLRVPFKDTHGEIIQADIQAQKMLEWMEQHRQQYPQAKFHLTYSANEDQTKDLRAAPQNWATCVDGANQAAVVSAMANRIKNSRTSITKDAIEIAPFTTMTASGTKVDKARVEDDIAKAKIVAENNDDNTVFLIWGNQNNTWAIGGGVTQGLNRDDQNAMIASFLNPLVQRAQSVTLTMPDAFISAELSDPAKFFETLQTYFKDHANQNWNLTHTNNERMLKLNKEKIKYDPEKHVISITTDKPETIDNIIRSSAQQFLDDGNDMLILTTKGPLFVERLLRCAKELNEPNHTITIVIKDDNGYVYSQSDLRNMISDRNDAEAKAILDDNGLFDRIIETRMGRPQPGT